MLQPFVRINRDCRNIERVRFYFKKDLEDYLIENSKLFSIEYSIHNCNISKYFFEVRILLSDKDQHKAYIDLITELLNSDRHARTKISTKSLIDFYEQVSFIPKPPEGFPSTKMEELVSNLSIPVGEAVEPVPESSKKPSRDSKGRFLKK